MPTLAVPFPRTLNFASPVNTAHPLNRGLVSWWLHVPGGSRGNILRDIMSGHHGTLSGGMNHDSALGRRGGYGSLTKSTTSSIVTVATHADYDLTTFSYGGWYYYNDTSYNWNSGFGKMNSSLSDPLTDWHWDMASSGHLRTFVWQTNPGSSDWITGYLIPQKAWFFVFLTFDASKHLRLYVNGALHSSNTTTFTSRTKLNNHSIRLGKHWDVSWRGSFSDQYVFLGALSDTDIFGLYESGLLGHPETLNWLSTRYYSVPAAGGGGFQAAWARQSSGVIGGGLH